MLRRWLEFLHGRQLSRVRKLDSHSCLAEHDFIVRLQPYAARTPKDRNSFAAADDPSSVFAAVIVQSEAAGRRLVGDVRMRPRNRLVDPAPTFREHHVIRPDQPVAVVTDFRTPADVYPRKGQ